MKLRSLAVKAIALCLTFLLVVCKQRKRPRRPSFMHFPRNSTAVVGSRARLPCSIKRLDTYSVIWRRVLDDTVISIDELILISGDDRFELEISADRKHWNLYIDNVETSDKGYYECQISSRKLLTALVLLNVRNGQYHTIDTRGNKNAGGNRKRGTAGSSSSVAVVGSSGEPYDVVPNSTVQAFKPHLSTGLCLLFSALLVTFACCCPT